jgi:membrane-bound metal-dependent hydrolase YbcI (DUF457 family)
MDNVTHTLFALTLSRTPLGRPVGATAALVLASNAPDLDIVASAGRAIDYLEWHRGPSHGSVGVLALAALTAGLVWSARRILRRKPSEDDASFRRLLLLGIVGTVGHIVMDLPTSYGTRLLSPFDWRWFAGDWIPIIDIYLLAILAAGLIFGRLGTERPRVNDGAPVFDARRRNATIALSLTVLYYGLRAGAHQAALDAAPAVFGPLLPPPCEGSRAQAIGSSPLSGLISAWPPDVQPALTRSDGMRCLVEVAAIPTFVSPFQWRLIAHMSNGYELANANLFDRRGHDSNAGGHAHWRLAVTMPNHWPPAAFQAARTHVGRTFLGFSRFPASRTFADRNGNVTVQWTDLRFLTDLRQRPRGTRTGMFTVTVHLGADGGTLSERVGP